MNNAARIAVVVALATAIVSVVVLRRRNNAEPPPKATVQQPQAGLPRLLDLGSDKCIPCQMMEPILEELRAEHEGTLLVDFIDVKRDPDAAKAHGVRVIPTQVFFDAAGKELFRHEGFYSKDDILKKWQELGVDLKAKPKPQAKPTPAPCATSGGL